MALLKESTRVTEDPLADLTAGKYDALMLKWAKWLMARLPSHLRMTLDDALGETSSFAVEALTKFDPDRGVQFITYLFRYVEFCSKKRLQAAWGPTRTPKGKACRLDCEMSCSAYLRSKSCWGVEAVAKDHRDAPTEAMRQEALARLSDASIITIQKLLDSGYEMPVLLKLVSRAGRMWAVRQTKKPRSKTRQQRIKVFVEERLGIAYTEFEALVRDVDSADIF